MIFVCLPTYFWICVLPKHGKVDFFLSQALMRCFNNPEERQLSQTSPGFYLPAVQVFRKDGGKRSNFSFSIHAIIFSDKSGSMDFIFWDLHPFCGTDPPLSLSLSHTHTHTHRDRETERERERENIVV